MRAASVTTTIDDSQRVNSNGWSFSGCNAGNNRSSVKIVNDVLVHDTKVCALNDRTVRYCIALDRFLNIGNECLYSEHQQITAAA